MKREIGGYMEMEAFYGHEYHREMLRFNLGRTALVWLLKRLECSRIFIPCYNCDSVANSVRRAGIAVEEYHVNSSLQPEFSTDFALNEGEWLYVINYYGQLDESGIRSLRKRFGRIIVDNAQAFFERPVDDIPTLYSCRKFFGVCDGAYLSCGFPEDESLERDMSKDRIGYLFGRLEENARTHYAEMRAESEKFAEAAPMKMSLLTENMLRGIDYENARLKRLENYRTLKNALPSDNPFTAREPYGPFAYPYFHEDGVGLRKALAEKNIFIPTNWSYLIDSMDSGSPEFKWSSDILPLPVDQRYSEEEMLYIAEMIKRY